MGIYDHKLPLIIDPVLDYATFLGGSSDETAYATATDSSGNTYIAGYTSSLDLPTTTGVLDRSFIGGTLDAFVAKFSPSGTLLYTTYLGGTGDEEAYGLAVDSQGNAYITGYTTSTDFPTTGGAYRNSLSGTSDAFVATTGTPPAQLWFIRPTWAGPVMTRAGVSQSTAWATCSSPGPRRPRTFRCQPGRIAAAYSGGDHDGFVTAIYPYGELSLFDVPGRFQGEDVPYAIAVDSSDNAYIAGETQSADFPNTPGVIQASKLGTTDAFVASINSAGTGLNYSTFLGGGSDDHAYGVAVDSSGNAYVTGYTGSTDFPHTAGVLQPVNGGGYDGFVAKINPSGTALVYCRHSSGEAATTMRWRLPSMALATPTSQAIHRRRISQSRLMPHRPVPAATMEHLSRS